MKDFIKFLRLDSLCGQLVAIAVLSLAALQCVNYYAVYSIQQSYAGEFLAVGHDYLASVCQALAHMSAAEREEYLASLDRSRVALEKPFRFRAAEAPEWETETDYYKSVLAREAVTEILTRAGIPPRDVRARVLYKDAPEASSPRYAGYVFPMMQMFVQSADGSWFELSQPLSVTDRRLIWRQRIFIMLESLICSAVVIIFIVRAMLPLNKLGKEVERFGANPETASPLPERGNYEVREVARSFNKMLARVQRSLAERNNMLEAMGHDLRTPLARVQLRLDAVEPPALREKLAANIEEIRSIIEQGLELARSLRTTEKAVPMEAAAFVESIADDMAADGGAVSFTDNAEGPLLIAARPTCLRRAVENLACNALKYAGGAELSVERRGESVIIRVEDRGPGIPPELLEKVFEPYFRVEGSRSRGTGGTGLGLTIARNMVLLNNGSLTLENREGGGLRAVITLPALKMAKIGEIRS
ncbi:MAG TPA: HAMP domain-containing protein [Candidatus Caccocola faecipullorum]|nr:HAMP domain-containing protein [Candidatus Caccocola faecipullorum]